MVIMLCVYLENPEQNVQKGLLWAQYGDVAVITTHMAFVNSDNGACRRNQTEQVCKLVDSLLRGNEVAHVVILGDFNMCLSSQTEAPFRDAGPRTKGSPSMYRGLP
jgi:endonuclease/exonuclease/phosphatase family metal-dependent hydrolase